jgi:hypothetical protein
MLYILLAQPTPIAVTAAPSIAVAPYVAVAPSIAIAVVNDASR